MENKVVIHCFFTQTHPHNVIIFFSEGADMTLSSPRSLWKNTLVSIKQRLRSYMCVYKIKKSKVSSTHKLHREKAQKEEIYINFIESISR